MTRRTRIAYLLIIAAELIAGVVSIILGVKH